MFYWNDSAYIRRDSNELILQGLKSRVRVKISDLSTNLFEQLAKQNMIDETNLEAREQRFLLRLNELGFLETEEYELESPHSRTARFLSYYSDAPLTLLKQIGAVHLAIVGMGGIGQVVAEHLAAAGVRHFTLIDGDRVERSNVNRQFLVGPDEIGEAKVEAVSKTLVNRYPDLSLNPVASYVRSAEELMRCVPSRTSMLVCAADSGEGVNPRSIVLEACIEKDIPCAFCAVGVADGEIGPILEKQSDMKSYLSFLQRAKENIVRMPVPKGSICFTNTLVGTALAMEIYRYLCTGSSPMHQHTCFCSFMNFKGLMYKRVGSENDTNSVKKSL